MQVRFTDNSGLVANLMQRARERALEEIGLACQRYAALKTPVSEKNGGGLRNSITHIVQGDTVYIGTNKSYAPYVEWGTGRYATDGNGRRGWWVYVEGSPSTQVNAIRRIYTEEEARQIMAILRRRGLDAHMTEGMRPSHMLRDAVSQHTHEYRQIILRAMSEV